MASSISIRACELVTRLDDDEGKSIINVPGILTIIESKKNCIRNYALIIHDKDSYSVEDESRDPKHKAGTLKPAHIHLLLRFKTNQPQRIHSVATWFKLSDSFVSKIFGRWHDAVLYLTHQNAPRKYQYSIDEVISNFDIEEVVNKAKERYDLEGILEKILDGSIREYNKASIINHQMLIYHTREINEAFKVRAEYLQETRQWRNTEVIFITGPSGCGKTTFAKKIATERKMDYYVSSGSNDVMDGYAQQPCLILDDIRPSCLGLSDLLKLLDNHTASLVKSRYKNKYLNCDLIILTSVLDIESFYSNVFEKENEPITQLKRRCGTYVQMEPDIIRVSRWDSAQMRYSKPHIFKNDILSQFVAKQPKTAEQVQQEIAGLMPFLTPEPLLPPRMGWYDLPCSHCNPPKEIISDVEFEKHIHMDESGDYYG